MLGAELDRDVWVLNVDGVLVRLSRDRAIRLDSCGSNIERFLLLDDERIVAARRLEPPGVCEWARGRWSPLAPATTPDHPLRGPLLWLDGARTVVAYDEQRVWLFGPAGSREVRVGRRIERLFASERTRNAVLAVLEDDSAFLIDPTVRRREWSITIPGGPLPQLESVQWSDSRALIVTSTRLGLVATRRGSQGVLISPHAWSMAALSPDGRWVAGVDTFRFHVVGTSPDLSGWSNVHLQRSEPTSIVWTSDARSFVLTYAWGFMRVDREADDGASNLYVPGASALSSAPDGSRVAGCVPTRRGHRDQVVLSTLRRPPGPRAPRGSGSRNGVRAVDLDVPDGTCIEPTLRWTEDASTLLIFGDGVHAFRDESLLASIAVRWVGDVLHLTAETGMSVQLGPDEARALDAPLWAGSMP